MAVEKNIDRASFQLQLDTEVQSGGVNVLKTATYSNVDSTSTTDNIFAVATGLAGLQKHTLTNVYYNEKSVLTEV